MAATSQGGTPVLRRVVPPDETDMAPNPSFSITPESFRQSESSGTQYIEHAVLDAVGQCGDGDLTNPSSVEGGCRSPDESICGCCAIPASLLVRYIPRDVLRRIFGDC